MPDPSPGSLPAASDQLSEVTLQSWKEIASYVKRDVSTVQRWEKREAMPIHRHLHDKRGSVYAFPSELDEWLRGRKPPLEDEQEVESAEGVESLESGRETDRTSRKQLWLALGGVLVLVLFSVAYIVSRSRTRDAAQPKIKSLAVLPLKNLSGDPTQEYFADGMTEAVIGRLSTIRGLRVISRTSVMRFKDTRMSVPEIAKSLNVDAIVEGSVMREGERVRVHAQLIRGATDEHFWSESYDRDLQDTLALQSEVAQSIARRVEATVSGEEHARLVAARHVSPEAYESYLKGRFAKRNSKAQIEQGIAYFEEAIQKDPTFAPAYVALAASYDKLGGAFAGVSPEEVRPKVISAVRKAVELDPDIAEAHVLLGDVYQKRWQWADAEVEYKRALELNPNDPAAHLGLAGWLLCQGHAGEAVAWAQRARELDPLGVAGLRTGLMLFYARRYDEAAREVGTELAVHPGNANALWGLGFVLIAQGKPGEAIPILKKAVSGSDRSPGVIGVLIMAYAQAGRRTDALRLLEELKRRQQAGYVPAAAFVNANLGLGDYEQAFVWFDRAYQEQSDILEFLRVHPFFDPLRNDPRFVELVHRVGLDQSR